MFSVMNAALEQIERSYKGAHSRIVCPFCASTRRKENQKERTMTLNKGEAGIVYYCHHCEASGVVADKICSDRKTYHKSAVSYPLKNKEVVVDPVVTEEIPVRDLGEQELSYLESRGIPKDVAQDYGVFGSDKYFRKIGAKHVAVGFPYKNKGITYAAKYRSAGETKDFTCDGAPQTFFGIDKVPVGDDLIIVEGEFDVLAFASVGIRAVSVPNGAPMKVSDGAIDPEEDRKFRFLWAAKEHLEKAKRIIIANEADDSGNALAEEIARRVGKDKCWRISWPEGSKDANETLLNVGPGAIDFALQGAKAWPVSGLYDADHFLKQVQEIYEKGIGKGESTGYPSVDNLYTIAGGQVCVVTGVPSSGKSEFVDQIMVNLAQSRFWKFAICSFENEPRFHITKLISKRVRKPFFEGPTTRINHMEFNAAFDWVNDHFVFVHQDDGSLSSLDDILERLRIAVLRHGIRGAVIDPYNFIARPRDISETDWVSEMLTKIKTFVMAHGIHLWFVAHPTKLKRDEKTGDIPAPKGYEISGSAAWFAKADVGMTVHRHPDKTPTEVEIHIWKCRYSWLGTQGQTKLVYDRMSTTYGEAQAPRSGPVYSAFDTDF